MRERHSQDIIKTTARTLCFTVHFHGTNSSKRRGGRTSPHILAATGIPFRNGNTVNAFVSTGFTKGVFDIDVKGIVELFGEGDRMHQANTTLRTSGKVYGTVITTALEIGLASYQQEIHYEVATITTVGIDF